MSYYKGSDPNWWKKGQGKGTSFKRCYHDHKPFELGGGMILGGNCGNPIVADYDIYIGLDSYSYKPQANSAYPWESKKKSKGPKFDFAFPISDMQAPADKPSFEKMIEWLTAQLASGMKVHVGCIGGHGRTGTVLAALVAAINSNPDATQWVRDNYCHKAVESTSQINYLHKAFGINKVKPTKGGGGSSLGQSHLFNDDLDGLDIPPTQAYLPPPKKGKSKTQVIDIEPLESQMCVWGFEE